MSLYARETFVDEWEQSVDKAKAKQAKRRSRKGPKVKRRRAGVNRLMYTPARKKKPQYCLDGKARGGCISKLTGRTEIDLTIYCPETSQMLGHQTLPDKVGEQTAAPNLILSTMRSLPNGFFTGDAGITSPAVVDAIRGLDHHYIFAIKGNAGKVYDTVTEFEWEEIEDRDLFFSEGHGRQEIRTIQSLPVEEFDCDEFDKYRDVSIVFKVTADIRQVKKDIFTTETRFFIGDDAAANLSHHAALTYIRDHWQLESYHWVKDVVLGEDDCPTKNSKGSQTLGLVRAAVVKVGKSLFGSVQKFADHFSSDPKGTYGS